MWFNDRWSSISDRCILIRKWFRIGGVDYIEFESRTHYRVVLSFTDVCVLCAYIYFCQSRSIRWLIDGCDATRLHSISTYKTVRVSLSIAAVVCHLLKMQTTLRYLSIQFWTQTSMSVCERAAVVHWDIHAANYLLKWRKKYSNYVQRSEERKKGREKNVKKYQRASGAVQQSDTPMYSNGVAGTDVDVSHTLAKP